VRIFFNSNTVNTIMDLRWLKLQGLAVLLGLGLLAVGSVVFEFQPGDVTTLYVFILLGSYFIIFAGVHVYLGMRGEGGAITVDARCDSSVPLPCC